MHNTLSPHHIKYLEVSFVKHFRISLIAGQSAGLCPLPHNRPKLGVSILTPSTTPRTILDLLGVNDQELQEEMAKGHPYAFKLLKQVNWSDDKIVLYSL